MRRGVGVAVGHGVGVGVGARIPHILLLSVYVAEASRQIASGYSVQFVLPPLVKRNPYRATTHIF